MSEEKVYEEKKQIEESYTVTKWTSPGEIIGLLFDSVVARVSSNFGKRTTPAVESCRADQINIRHIFNKLNKCS